MSKRKDADLDVLASAVDAARRLGTRAQELIAEYAATTKEIAATERALDRREDVLRQADEVVDKAAASWRAQYTGRIVEQLSHRREVIDGTTRTREAAPELPWWGRTADGVRALTFRDLAGLAPDMVKASLRATIEAAPDAMFGPGVEARAARLQELRTKLAALEEEHDELTEGAARFGVTLPAIPEVAARREREGRKPADWVGVPGAVSFGSIPGGA